MLTNKSLLYGLGLGLIIGTLLLQLMNITKMPSTSSDVSPHTGAIYEMDKQQLKEAAQKYYQVFEKDQKLFNQEQANALIVQKLQEEKDKQLAAPAKETSREIVKEIYVYISAGLTAGKVADLLVQSGVVTDRRGFEVLMQQQQLNGQIVSGVYQFTSPMELPQVVSIITTRQ